ncbi:MAG TPA: DNA polymerase III subunit alpha, partial [Pseudomonadales bacterium]|nr:DNA polymerase III subunit alpha [Pseudomonadales bacterium]
EIAKRCNVKVNLGDIHLPEYQIPDGYSTESFFYEVSERGLEQRLEKILYTQKEDHSGKRRVYEDRLAFELDVINKMGFAGYFLIVMEFVEWARDNDIPVGPGRGSGAGSLVAYALRITDVDPLEYDLLFERFLNPERVSLPDFDIDFCMDGRDRVIQHVTERYGRNAVSQIITFGTMAAKAVVRDVARVQGKSYGLADKLSKLIPFKPGMTLDKALDEEPLLGEFISQNEDADEIMEMAFKLEGLARNVGKHAGGVVIAPTRITDYSPIYCDESGANFMTQFDMNDVEQAGLVKFDFLGLRTLTIIDNAVKSINQHKLDAGDELIEIGDIFLEDPAVFEDLRAAKTTAVFQLESRGMKDLIKQVKPNRFGDIVALVALFRPGPLELKDDFVRRKIGIDEVDYLHPSLQPVLEGTYGVMLYQEQVMQIAQVLAGYTLADADLLRRAMGKKKPEEMAKQRDSFLRGAQENGVDGEQADHIFNLMEKFAGYGFNKPHSVAYALIAYQTAWLKHYYPVDFMAAVLSADMQNTDKVVINIEECREMDIAISPPNVNKGGFRFVADSDKSIIYGLGAIKGVGEGPVEAIVNSRCEDGQFDDLYDLCERVDGRKVNKRAIEALIGCGALDELACFDSQ